MVDTAIDRLVMDSNNKELIKAVAQVYTDSDRPDRFSGDFIRGKGEGQIILLHGPPGTGKTLTAVFLRALDYFEGILFLTTNRVGQFDEAFISRIHLSLGYDKLTNESRSKIWDNMFRKLKDDHKRGGREILYEYHAKSYVKSKEVQSLEWNGREIRNAFQTAVALAIFDAKRDKKEPPEMTEKHLNQVVQMSSAFRKYMTAAHSGMDDSTWAFKHGNREDKFPSTPAKTDG
ncbi:hypothetical protein J4E85_007209 [Alternaria conjuncta]|uniref:uncharacterized protein n=1 Tax=Alternaria conjuncta TaxID=181017 RepID=UPI00221F1831|nr:uncharacterized protein J4E85_007209 [Alternaria conjuncta]KAI4925330.1 hypothetical protein J4E85_007209 [Alternaria conjuncta]